MIPSTWPLYREALARPHRAYSRVEVWRAGIKVEELAQRTLGNSPYTADTPVFLGGSVRATYSSQITRTLTLQVPEHMYPWETTDLLAPYGNELRVFRGLEYGSGSRDEFPIFRGPIVRPAPPQRQGSLTVTASDRAFLVIKNAFDSPRASTVGAPLVEEVERLILDGLPDAEFGTHDAFTETVPELAYDDERGTALDNLCKTASAVWYALADGRFVVRRVPWSAPVTAAPVQLYDGDGGTLASAYPDRSVEGLYNRVTVTSERPDGAPAMYATASDVDPASPTFIGGPFGVRSTRVRVTGAYSQDQLLRAAEDVVRRSRARTEAWQYACVPDASLELGDLIESRYRDRRARQFIAGFTMPLEPAGTMGIDGRDTTSREVEE